MRHRRHSPLTRRHLYFGAAAVAVAVLLAGGTALAVTDDGPKTPTLTSRAGTEAAAPARTGVDTSEPDASGAAATGAGDQTAGPSASATNATTSSRPVVSQPPPAGAAAGPAKFATLAAGAAL